jgi:hypothetical protein
MFIPVRAGLRKIREIILTPMVEENNEIKVSKMLLCIFNKKRNELKTLQCGTHCNFSIGGHLLDPRRTWSL